MWLDRYPKCKMGLTAMVANPRAWQVHDVARKIPLDRLLLETDSPYFMPSKLLATAKQEELIYNTTHPGYVGFVAAQIAALKNVPVVEVIEATGRNAVEVYYLNEHNTLEEIPVRDINEEMEDDASYFTDTTMSECGGGLGLLAESSEDED